MSEEITGIVEAVIARAPEWIRRDLMSSEASTRTRAEEALAAMITAALQSPTPTQKSPAA